MKKTILLLALALSAGIQGLTAATIAVTPAAQNVTLGSQAIVTIEFSGGSVGDFDVDVYWRSSILSLDSFSFGTQLGGPSDSFQSDGSAFFPDPNLLGGDKGFFEVSNLLSAQLLALQPGSVTLLTLVFNTSAVGTGEVNLGLNAIGDADGIGYSLTALTQTNGVINVVAGGPDVPEPSTWMLAAAGVSALLFKRRLAS